MRILLVSLVSLAAGSLVQCEHNSGQRIPPGVYEEPLGQERVVAKDSKLRFELRMVRGRDAGEIRSDEYSYEILTSGEIHVIGTSSDPVFMGGIVRYYWSWNEKQIVRKLVEPVRDENGNGVGTKLGPPVVFARKTQEH